MGGGSSHANRDEYYGQIIYIHGVPYEFRERLGEGGFATVYAAVTPNGMSRAIKVVNLQGLPPEEGIALVKSYLNEVALLNRLRKQSHHVVRIYDFDFDPSGQGYIVMELGGDNLSGYIKQLNAAEGGIDPFMIREFWRQMLDIVYTLHSHSIIHMDFKPANLIVFGDTLKIADLGTSRKEYVLGDAQVGTPGFSAPEIMQDIPGFQRYYGPQADIWSLGAILYYMVYGKAPKYRRGRRPSKPPRGLPRYPDPLLNDILRLTLVRNPYRRADLATLFYHPFTQS